MSDKTNIMQVHAQSWIIPAHFEAAIRAALDNFAKDGYLFEGVKFEQTNNDKDILFHVTAGPYDLFRLGVKVGTELSQPAPAEAPLTEVLEDYINAIRKAQDDHWKEMNFSIPKDVFSVTEGKRFWKIVAKGPGDKYGSVHCFVERSTGDIYKAATFHQPAKGARGNIRDKDRPVSLRDYYRK